LSTWLQLPDITEEEAVRLDAYTGRFVGEPGFEFGEGQREGEAEEAGQKPAMTEEKRLTAVIKQIDQDVQIVPRGAYYRDALHKINVNQLSKGTSVLFNIYSRSRLHGTRPTLLLPPLPTRVCR
jgi:radial spoke head protein 9